MYAAIGIAVNYTSDKIADETEARLFSSISIAMLETGARSNLVKTPEFLRAEQIFSHLLEQPELRQLNYKLYYDAEPLPNAFAAPGGGVSVTAGLLKMVKSEVGLAMVLAHELGHHQARHALRSIGRGLALTVVMTIFFGNDNALVSQLLGLAEASHSRSQERVADAMGLKMVYRTLGTTAGAFEFFEELDKKKSIGDSKFLRLLSSHPYTPDRIAALRLLERNLLPKNLKKNRTGNNQDPPANLHRR